MTAEQKEIGDVMAAALRKLRSMTIVTSQDVAIGEELARRWDVVSAPAETQGVSGRDQGQIPR